MTPEQKTLYPRLLALREVQRTKLNEIANFLGAAFEAANGDDTAQEMKIAQGFLPNVGELIAVTADIVTVKERIKKQDHDQSQG